MKNALYAILALGMTLLSASANEYPVKLIRVADGDTIVGEINLGFRVYITQRIRIAGVDVYELSDPQGKEAKDFLASFIEGKKLVLKTTKRDLDKYGRPLGFLYANGESVTDVMKQHGYERRKIRLK